MSSRIDDIVEGEVRRGSDGWSATRVFNVTMDAGGNPKAYPYKATQVTGIPQYGDPHPVIPGIKVADITCTHDNRLDPLHYDVRVEYRGDEAGTQPGLEGSGIKSIDVQSSTVTEQTYVDHKGNNLIVIYKGPEFQLQTAVSSSGIVSYPYYTTRFTYHNAVLDAEYEVPTVTVTVTVEKSRPSHVASLNAAGVVNNSQWSGLGAKKWLCVGIDSNKNSNGGYDWRHQFAIAPQFAKNKTWMFRAEPKLRRTIDGFQGYSTSNTVGNGVEFFDLYPPVDFRRKFGFTIPS